jgi:uncharacterized membrane protein
MATLTVWRFDSPEGADAAVETLRSLEKQELITVHDAATVDKVHDAFSGQQAELIDTNLSQEQERAIREVVA